MDEGRRGVAVDDVVREEASAGWWTKEGVGLLGNVVFQKIYLRSRKIYLCNAEQRAGECVYVPL